jgi:hypothetical protein
MALCPDSPYGIGGILGEQVLFAKEENDKPERED